jgi:cytochrome c2
MTELKTKCQSMEKSKAAQWSIPNSARACHTLDAIDPKPHKGPSLGLIYNKRAGSNMNFHDYTDQLIKSTFFWSPLNLYRFMADPESLVPKTTCWLAKHPLTSEEDRADLITMFR